MDDEFLNVKQSAVVEETWGDEEDPDVAQNAPPAKVAPKPAEEEEGIGEDEEVWGSEEEEEENDGPSPPVKKFVPKGGKAKRRAPKWEGDDGRPGGGKPEDGGQDPKTNEADVRRREQEIEEYERSVNFSKGKPGLMVSDYIKSAGKGDVEIGTSEAAKARRKKLADLQGNPWDPTFASGLGGSSHSKKPRGGKKSSKSKRRAADNLKDPLEDDEKRPPETAEQRKQRENFEKTRKKYTKEITKILKANNRPKKIGSLSGQLKKHQLDMHAFYEKVCKRYKVEPKDWDYFWPHVNLGMETLAMG